MVPGYPVADTSAATPEAALRASALSVRSQVKSWSALPKCPYTAVLLKIGRVRSRSRRDRSRTQVEMLAHELLDAGHGDALRPEAFNGDRHRMRDTDCVRDLQLAAIRQPAATTFLAT